MDEHERLRDRLRGYERDTNNDIFDYAKKIDAIYNSPEYVRYEIFNDYNKVIKDLSGELMLPISDEERGKIERDINEIKKEMIQRVNATRER